MEPAFKEGDKVYLLRKHIKTKRPSTKLDFKKLGPFKILNKVSSVNYKLQLPKDSRLHPVFHVSLLEPARGDTPLATNDEIQPENDPHVYQVERILDRRLVGKEEQYLIKWEGYEHTDNTWEPAGNVSRGLLRAWMLRISKASLCVLLVCCVVHVYKAEVFASKVASRVCVCAREPHPVYIDLSFPLSFLFSFFSL